MDYGAALDVAVAKAVQAEVDRRLGPVLERMQRLEGSLREATAAAPPPPRDVGVASALATVGCPEQMISVGAFNSEKG
jgi:hypothetical protein